MSIITLALLEWHITRRTPGAGARIREEDGLTFSYYTTGTVQWRLPIALQGPVSHTYPQHIPLHTQHAAPLYIQSF